MPSSTSTVVHGTLGVGLGVALVVGVLLAALPLPALARGLPQTLAAARAVGDVRGGGPVVENSFPIDYLGMSWTSGEEPQVRFRVEGQWWPWQVVHEDEIPQTGDRTFSRLVWAYDADAYQIRGDNRGVKATAINTTDGPRALTWSEPTANASHLAQPPVVSRAQWGADESLRFDSSGKEKCTRDYWPTQKLIVHHTATRNNDPDPAATVRAIYRFHVGERGWCDIGYNFLVGPDGLIYKGRYSGPQGTKNQDTPTGENEQGYGVTGAHTAGYNSATMGIALLGNFVDVAPTEPAQDALVEHLAWESDRHGIDPEGADPYVNPVTGASRVNPNISGHRDWVATECPGGVLYAMLPTIRQETAARSGQEPEPEPPPPCPEDAICGTDGPDEITGTEGDDVIYAFGDHDIVNALGGNDVVYAGDGDDIVDAGAGDDVVYGQDGNDTLRGRSGGDTLRGGPGHDLLYGHNGQDSLHGGAGDDTISGNRRNDQIIGGDGDDSLWGHRGYDVVRGFAGNDFINGGGGNDILGGGDGNDTLQGRRGDDSLHGGPGIDSCNGGAGRDTVRACE